MAYSLEVVRNANAPYGAGMASLYLGDSKISEWPCITGGAQKDPRLYAGLTPPIFWEMTELIQKRHLRRANRSLVMARIVPAYDEERALYVNPHGQRTFDRMELDPFMLHVAGRSTGCIAIVRPYWSDFMTKINQAFEKNGNALMIHVIEKDIVLAMEAHALVDDFDLV